MAGTLTLTGSIEFEGEAGGRVDSEGVGQAASEVSVSSEKHIKSQLTVTTTEVAIPLGGVSSLGYAMFKNLDATNFIEIRVGTAGTKIIKLGPGQSSGPFRFGTGITAPYAIADTATCEMAYEIFSN